MGANHQLCLGRPRAKTLTLGPNSPILLRVGATHHLSLDTRSLPHVRLTTIFELLFLKFSLA